LSQYKALKDKGGNMTVKLDENFFRITGDPFVDAGALALEYLSEQFPDKSLENIYEFATEVYLKKWGKKLHSVFHTNGVNKIGTKSLKDLFKAYLKEEKIYKNQKQLSECGGCRICGRNSVLYHQSREFFPIVGSGSLVNFYHSHENGIFLCSNCSVKLFFMPFTIMFMSRNLVVPGLRSGKIKKYWAKKTILKNLADIGRNNSEGIIKSLYSNPKNALFAMATELIIEMDAENESLQLFHFTNFGQSPYSSIYYLPNPVFIFMSKVIRSCSAEWFAFVRRHYLIKQTSWDYKNSKWGTKDGILKDEDYLNNKNLVFERLISEKSILGLFCRYFRENFFKEIKISSLMVDYYLKEVRNMSPEQMELIKKLGKSIIEIARKEGNFKKYLTKIEGAGKAYQLRSVLISLVKKNYAAGEERPLITLGDYVEYLFPDGQYWGEVRDLLLIYLYELLHEENVKGIEVEEIPLEETDEKELSEI
jgi:CRISPR-associated protein Cst1